LLVRARVNRVKVIVCNKRRTAASPQRVLAGTGDPDPGESVPRQE
jgi:hypothetical protein